LGELAQVGGVKARSRSWRCLYRHGTAGGFRRSGPPGPSSLSRVPGLEGGLVYGGDELAGGGGRF